MRKLGITLAMLGVLVMVATAVDSWRFSSLKKRARLIKQGANKSEVQSLLGRPSSVFMPDTETNFVVWLLSVRSETWGYGRIIDVPSAFRGEWPFYFRMFSPDSNDVAVVFGASGRVAHVIVP